MMPVRMFLTKGVGRHKERLASFELALRDAGIEKYNLVSVSSIFPPNCKIVQRVKGVEELHPGQIVHCVIARQDTDEHNRLVAASIGIALPANSEEYGYLSEVHMSGATQQAAGDYAEDLAASMLATTLGIEYDENLGWDERQQIYKLSGKIIKTHNITQSAEGKTDLWTTVIASAVLIPGGI